MRATLKVLVPAICLSLAGSAQAAPPTCTGNIGLGAFERAGAIAHSADTEMAMVRTCMQAGGYRRAAAFAAHTAGAHRGPVFDVGGRFAGVAVPDADGRDRLLPVSALRLEFGALLGVVADQGPARRAPVAGIYENAMPIALQVIARP